MIIDSCNFEDIKIGDILDAQDYLSNWYLSIVIDAKTQNQKTEKKIHFLPFQAKQGRDEDFS